MAIQCRHLSQLSQWKGSVKAGKLGDCMHDVVLTNCLQNACFWPVATNCVIPARNPDVSLVSVAVQVHTVGELERVLKLKLEGCMLGINNRDLGTFKVDLQNNKVIMDSAPGQQVQHQSSCFHCLQDCASALTAALMHGVLAIKMLRTKVLFLACLVIIRAVRKTHKTRIDTYILSRCSVMWRHQRVIESCLIVLLLCESMQLHRVDICT